MQQQAAERFANLVMEADSDGAEASGIEDDAGPHSIDDDRS
jgi:hypothetical protein